MKSDEKNIPKREAANRDPRGPPGSQKGPKIYTRGKKEPPKEKNNEDKAKNSSAASQSKRGGCAQLMFKDIGMMSQD